MHARLRSPCTFPSASSDEQRGGLGLCQTHDASAAIKPVPRHPKKGYAVDVLATEYGIDVRRTAGEARKRLLMLLAGFVWS